MTNGSVDASAPVAIAGGGPVGMALAIDLALRGVETLVFEKREANAPIYARANMTNVQIDGALQAMGNRRCATGK